MKKASFCKHQCLSTGFFPFFLQSVVGNDQPCVSIVYDTYVHARMLHPVRVSVQVKLTRAANAYQAPFEPLFFLKKKGKHVWELAPAYYLPMADRPD